MIKADINNYQNYGVLKKWQTLSKVFVPKNSVKPEDQNAMLWIFLTTVAAAVLVSAGGALKPNKSLGSVSRFLLSSIALVRRGMFLFIALAIINRIAERYKLFVEKPVLRLNQLNKKKGVQNSTGSNVVREEQADNSPSLLDEYYQATTNKEMYFLCALEISYLVALSSLSILLINNGISSTLTSVSFNTGAFSLVCISAILLGEIVMRYTPEIWNSVKTHYPAVENKLQDIFKMKKDNKQANESAEEQKPKPVIESDVSGSRPSLNQSSNRVMA